MAARDADQVSGGWLGPALRVQSAVAAALVTALCVAALGGVPLGTGVQLGALLGGMALVGVPHGAFDHLVARPVLAPRLGPRWWVAFLAGYLGLAGLVALAWTTVPVAALAGFLALSVLHFGLGDVEDGLAPASLPRLVPVAAYGALPVLLPATLHPSEAAPVLAALGGLPTAGMEAILRDCTWLLPLWGALFAWTVLAAWRERRPVAERVAMAAGFALLPPLLAFAAYFTAGHSVRHVLRLGAWHDPRRPVAALGWLATVLLPAAALTALGLAALAWLGQGAGPELLTPLFRTIAALTLPHVLVTAWLEGRGVAPAT